jgi:hypothetical protein
MEGKIRREEEPKLVLDEERIWWWSTIKPSLSSPLFLLSSLFSCEYAAVAAAPQGT